MATPSKARGVREGEDGGLVTDEHVEAVARGLRDADCTGHDHGTSACPDRHCRADRTLPVYRERARAALRIEDRS
jgi:hypothetical protein